MPDNNSPDVLTPLPCRTRGALSTGALSWLTWAVLTAACDTSTGGPTGPADLGPQPDQAQSCAATPAAPFGTNAGDTIDPSLSFIDSAGQALSLGGLATPCAPGVVALRLTAAWCGPCKLAPTRNSDALQGIDDAQLIEVLSSDEQNRPVADAALRRFAATLPAGSRAVRHAVYSHELLPRLGLTPASGEHLPLVLVIDRRTLRIVSRLADPGPEALRFALRDARQRSQGLPPPEAPTPTLIDGRFTSDRWALVQGMAITAALRPPPDTTNRVADSADAATLGRLIFNDIALGGVGMMSCAFCHRPSSALQDGRATAAGVNPAGAQALGDRNTPWLGSVAFARTQLWDGRADSLWAQALGPIENDREFASNRMRVVRRVFTLRANEYRAVFGAPPDVSDASRFPTDARPGMASWDAMSAADRTIVNRAYSNLGKAIAAYERTLRPLPVALDRYAAGDSSALTAAQKDGLVRFFDLGCAQCHYGPMLNDGAFHALGFATGRRDGAIDRGRRGGLAELLGSDFRSDGAFSDDPSAAPLGDLADDPIFEGQFKTPALRGIADTAPYGHGGTYADLPAVLNVLASGGDSGTTSPARDPALIRFDAASPKNDNLLLFLRTLTGDVTTP